MTPRGQVEIVRGVIGAAIAKGEFPGCERALLTVLERALREAIEADQRYGERILDGKRRPSDESDEDYGTRMLNGVELMVDERQTVLARIAALEGGG